MSFNVIPYEGTDLIKLNVTREENRSKFMDSFLRECKRQNIEYDQFTNFLISYDEKGISDAIEFYETAQVYFNGMLLMNEEYTVVEDIFKNLDNDLIIEDNVGFRTLKYQIGIYAPYGKVEAILVGRKGYYQ